MGCCLTGAMRRHRSLCNYNFSMCGRYRLKHVERLAERFEAIYCGNNEEIVPRYNIAPTQPIPVIRATESGREITSIRWGLIPSWVKDTSAARINSRSETVVEKPAFRESFERRRCLIPADGFYEWVRSGKLKQPFHFGMKDGSLFAFAGIWDRWKPPTGPLVESCAILTTSPNELLRDVHDRMPVILRPEHYSMWLNAPTSASGRLADILLPYDAGAMRRFPVSECVNDPANETPDCLIETAELIPAQHTLFR
jgi:putative SOS response-associated peptidase YedK